MQDTSLYQYPLGLQSPWTMSRVNLDGQVQSVRATPASNIAAGV